MKTDPKEAASTKTDSKAAESKEAEAAAKAEDVKEAFYVLLSYISHMI